MQDMISSEDEEYPLFPLENVVERLKIINQNDLIEMDASLHTASMKHVIRLKDWQYPLFPLDRLVERLQMREGEKEESILNGMEVSKQLLLWLQPVSSSDLQFASFSADVVDAIGLSNAKLAWQYISNYTIASILILGACYIIHLSIKRKCQLAKNQELFKSVLEAAYDHLAQCDNNEGYAALMLRDDIGRDMYPTNLHEQAFLCNNVWPGVIVEVHSDNRICKFHKEANGKNLEHWDLHKHQRREGYCASLWAACRT